jgi:hypothetical protein
VEAAILVEAVTSAAAEISNPHPFSRAELVCLKVDTKGESCHSSLLEVKSLAALWRFEWAV